MGCFPGLKSKKKRVGDPPLHPKRSDHEEHKPTALPEPPPTRSLQSAPPSFRTRVKPIHSSSGSGITSDMSSRIRALSAPSSLHGAAETDTLATVHHEEQEELKGQRGGSGKEQTKSSSPQPLPLPSPQAGSVLKTWGSFKSFNASGPLYASGPLPLPPSGSVRSFSYEEVVAACSSYPSDRCISEGLSSVMYMASFGDDVGNSKKVEATVVRFHPSNQSIREFINEVNTLASLQHPNLCKLLGYHAGEGSELRMLVYERLAHGGLDRLLYGRSDGPPLDWNTRMKIALCAAQGLTFLHEEGPFQAMYNEFSTANIQVDKDFSAKLSGYGCAGHAPEAAEASTSSVALANLSVETVERGVLTPKSNVWSFGVVLLEVLTGRKNMDGRYPKEERNLVKWSRAFLADDCRLSLIMDPQLKGRFPAKGARSVADIAQKCLQVEPSERPTMRKIVENLKIIQEMKYACRFPLREPAAGGKYMSRSSSMNTIVVNGVGQGRSSLSPSPPASWGVRRQSESPSRRRSRVPVRACLTLEELEREEVRRSSSAASGRRASVEGF